MPTGAYEVRETQFDSSQAYLKASVLRCGRREANSLSVAATTPYTRRSRAAREKAISETFIPLDRQKIESLADAPEAVSRFVAARTLASDSSPSVYFPAYRVAPSERLISDGAARFMNDLSMVASNDIYVPPTLLFSEEDSRSPDQRRSLYFSLLRRALKAKRSSTHGEVVPGVLVPKFLGYGSMISLFDAFGEEDARPSFVAIDFGNSRISDPGIQQKLAWVHRYFRSNRIRNYFVHALRVRPRKRGLIPADAEDMATFLSGVDTIGPVRRGAPTTIPSFDWDSLIAFSHRDYSYGRLDGKTSCLRDFEEFLSANRVDAPPLGQRPQKRDSAYLGHVRDFNRWALNSEGMTLFELVISSNLDGVRRRLAGKRGLGLARQVRNRASEGFL